MQNKNVPALRFPEFNGDWDEKEHGEIFSFRVTNSLSRENLNYESGGVKNIHYGDIHTKFNTLFDITKEYVPFINSGIKLNKIADENYCKEGDLVIADASEDYADVGKCIEIKNLNNEKVLAGLHTFLARPDLFKMPIGFNGYLMKSPKVRLQIMTIAQGTKVLSISTNRLSKIKLNIPKEEIEQQKIAGFLTAVDEKIQQLVKKKDLLNQYKKGVMQKIFNQEIRFKDVNGNDFADWEEKQLSEVGEINPKCKKLPESFIYIDLESVEGGNLLKENKISSEKAPSRAQRLLEKNDILYQTVRPYQKNNLFFDKDGIYVASTGYAQIRTKNNAKFLYQYLHTDNFVDKVLLRCTGTSYPAINSTDLSIIKISFPSLPEQGKIAGFLSGIDDKLNLVNRQLERTKEYKKGLLQQMFV